MSREQRNKLGSNSKILEGAGIQHKSFREHWKTNLASTKKIIQGAGRARPTTDARSQDPRIQRLGSTRAHFR